MESTPPQNGQPRNLLQDLQPRDSQQQDPEVQGEAVPVATEHTQTAGESQSSTAESVPIVSGQTVSETTALDATVSITVEDSSGLLNILPNLEDLAKLGTELDGIDARLVELDNK